MRNVIGNNLTLTIFGESHNEYIGVTIDGLTPGIKIDYDYINKCLSRRRPQGKKETNRIEMDQFKIVSGVFNNYTTGSSLTILIPNQNVISSDYDELAFLMRPSHADYVSNVKYHGYNDYRGGGHFSGRITAPLVVVGAILIKALEKFNIHISSHIKQIGSIFDRDFVNVEEDILKVKDLDFPVLDNVKEQMEEEIEKARINQDSIGGIIQLGATNVPVGLGEPFFSSLESEISRAMFSIGGVKGIEFGLGFDFGSKKASEVNDYFVIKDEKVITKTNNNGGINGGISNGMPIVFNLVVKPTPSISREQDTISLKEMTNEKLIIKGRHDPCIVRRICIISESLLAFVLSDMLITRYGSDVFLKEKID